MIDVVLMVVVFAVCVVAVIVQTFFSVCLVKDGLTD